jgi:hypothetical protein
MSKTSAPTVISRGATCVPDAKQAAAELRDAIGQTDAALVIFFCSPEYDLSVLAGELRRHFGPTPLIGCTTSGEISPLGYLTGSLAGVALPRGDFVASTIRIDNLADFELRTATDTAQRAVGRLTAQGVTPAADNTFAFLMIDGLSCREEAVVSGLYRALGDIQLFGGSAADGIAFGRTHIFHEGAFRTGSAVLSLISTTRPFEIFKTQHFVSSNEKMVVTGAVPEFRVVTEINGRPAGREYARVVGLNVNELTPMIFSSYPVVVRIGGSYYVRSIQKVNDDESLTFFCAINEGVVLTVGRGVDLVENLVGLFDGIRSRMGAPELVLGCDCVLRHLEIDQKSLKDSVADILKRNRVIGFSTYGEQYNAMHVNQTFTGVAIGSRR